MNIEQALRVRAGDTVLYSSTGPQWFGRDGIKYRVLSTRSNTVHLAGSKKIEGEVHLLVVPEPSTKVEDWSRPTATPQEAEWLLAEHCILHRRQGTVAPMGNAASVVDIEVDI